ncbi:MAG: pyruvate kinase, partial [Pelosinus sp.]|nr:pyruvate kinase [Pelosinus sp.]
GADGATERLTDGAVVTVDAARGLVYSGEINAR